MTIALNKILLAQIIFLPVLLSASESIVREYENDVFRFTHFSSWRVKKESFDTLHLDSIGSSGQAASLSFNIARINERAAKELTHKMSGKNEHLANELTTTARVRFPTYKILDHGETILGNFPAYYVEASYLLENLGTSYLLHAVQIYAVHRGYLVVIQYEASDSFFSIKLSEFRAMLSTFNYK